VEKGAAPDGRSERNDEGDRENLKRNGPCGVKVLQEKPSDCWKRGLEGWKDLTVFLACLARTSWERGGGSGIRHDQTDSGEKREKNRKLCSSKR